MNSQYEEMTSSVLRQIAIGNDHEAQVWATLAVAEQANIANLLAYLNHIEGYGSPRATELRHVLTRAIETALGISRVAAGNGDSDG